MMKSFRLAMVQLAVGKDKAKNVQHACQMVRKAVQKGANMVVLPECFNSPYGTSYFPEYAETIPGTTTDALSAVAKECSIFLIGGSLPERDGDKLYNTCPVFNPMGHLVAKHRKMHLFNVDIPGKITFQESETLSPGNSLTTVDTDWCKVGIGICYDVRFPELAQLYAKKGCKLLCYPGAFNMTSGPVHYELLHAGRALDNQLYVAAVSPARDENASYVVWGHSTAIDPWGKVIGKCDHKEDTILVNIDPDYVDTVRSQIPCQFQKRHDIYEVTEK